MKHLQIGKKKLLVCEHKGDITYERFVKFKQYAPQFWERMDSPLFEVYWEEYTNLMNQGKYMQAYGKMSDYKLAIKQAEKSYDAWGICFVLITGETEDELKTMFNDAQIQERLNELNAEGLTAEVVAGEVVNFMKTSPETFTDHLSLYAIAGMISDITP